MKTAINKNRIYQTIIINFCLACLIALFAIIFIYVPANSLFDYVFIGLLTMICVILLQVCAMNNIVTYMLYVVEKFNIDLDNTIVKFDNGDDDTND